jgi:hypothetical protein
MSSSNMSYKQLMEDVPLLTQPGMKPVPPTFTLQGSQPYALTSEFMAGKWPPTNTFWDPKVRQGYIGWSVDIPKENNF